MVSAARCGDDRAFEELYSRYRERIAGFILARVHDHGRAEDIAQDVFISALRRLRANDQEIAFKPWIYEIAKNACIDEFRRSKRTREVSLDADEELTVGRRGLLSVAPTPPAAVESKQKLDDLQGAFGGLSESHHKLLVMREFEGLSYNEIGARTGMSRQVVESTLFRARRKLTEEYDEIASGRRCEHVTALIEEGGAQSLRSCGVRQRRQMTRHLAHCQPCRRNARLAGVDESFIKPRSIAAKIAACLPFPIWRWRWRGGAKGAATKGAAAKGGSAGAGSIAGAAGSAGSSITLGQAAAAAAALAIAGAGGGAVTGLWSGKHVSRPTVNIRNSAGPHSGGSAGAQSNASGAPGAAAPGAASAHRAAASAAAQKRLRQTSHRAHGRVSGGAGGATPGGSAGAKGAAAPTGSPASGSAPATGQPSATGTAGSTVTGTVKSASSGARTIVRKTVGAVLPTQPAGSGPLGSTVHKVTSTVGRVLPGATSGAGSTVSSTAGKVVSTVNGTASAVGGAAHDAGSAVGGAAHDAGSAVGGVAHHAGSTAGSTGTKVTSTAGSTAAKVTSTAGSTAAKVTSGSGAATKKVTSTASAVASGILP